MTKSLPPTDKIPILFTHGLGSLVHWKVQHQSPIAWPGTEGLHSSQKTCIIHLLIDSTVSYIIHPLNKYFITACCGLGTDLSAGDG